MPSPVLGIDLGTTNSVVAYADEQRVRVLRDDAGRLLTPSTVSFLPDGTILVGSAARDQRLLDVENTVFSVKRLIGRPYRSQEVRRAAERLPFKMEEGATGGVVVRIRKETYSLPEISSFILRELRELAERSIGVACTNAVITVPANFNELQRMATRDAGRIAGLNVLRILNEPTAAALAYGYHAQQQQRIAVYDFGGGTFDISILELSGDVIEVVATAGDTHLGGDDLDRALAERMVDAFKAEHGIDLHRDAQQYERLVMAAEWLKCQLSELDAAEATIREVANVHGRAIDLTCRISRSELYELCSPLIGRTFSICEDALKLARVRPTQLDGVILVGGQTRTPRVREMVAEYFGMDPKYSVDPDLAVAQGAALQGYALSGVPAAAGERKAARTLMGPATAPPPAGDPFEDEPTRIATPRESRASQEAGHTAGKRSETPFDDLPTTITERDTDSEMTKVGEVRVTQPRVKPEGVPGTHASTLAGVGAPAPALSGVSRRRPDSEPVTVSSETNPSAELADEPIISLSDDAGISLEHEDEADYEFAHDSIAELEEDEPDFLELPVVTDRSPKTLAETPSAKAGMRPSRLPADIRLTPPRPAGSAAVAPKHLPPPSAAGSAIDDVADLPAVLRDGGEEDPSTTLLERPRAKAKTGPPAADGEAAAAESTEEPIRTHSMARLLASQGHIERALSIYRDLLARNPIDPILAAEARALRAQRGARDEPAAASLPAPAQTSSLKPPTKTAAVPPARKPDASARSLSPPPAAATRPLRPSADSARASEPPDEPPPLQLAALVESEAPLSLAPLRTRSPIPAPAPQNQQSQFPAPPRVAPLLLDVTPHTLCVETVGGFCEPIIERNAAIPTEQTRVFTTSRDNQVTVSVRVCQGESRHTDDNEVLGQIDLLGLRQARRGEVHIAVTFVIDVDGTLNVRAIDEATGHGQEIEVNLVGAIGAQEIERMRTRQRAAR